MIKCHSLMLLQGEAGAEADNSNNQSSFNFKAALAGKLEQQEDSPGPRSVLRNGIGSGSGRMRSLSVVRLV